jgi:hypothetical protein
MYRIIFGDESPEPLPNWEGPPHTLAGMEGGSPQQQQAGLATRQLFRYAEPCAQPGVRELLR